MTPGGLGGGLVPSDRMTEIEPVATPNPDALKFPLPFRLASSLNVRSAETAAGVPFAAAVFAAGGVAAVFAVNDFVTVTRIAGADWTPIVDAVRAASPLLRPTPEADCADDGGLETARELLRAAMQAAAGKAEDTVPTPVALGGVRRHRDPPAPAP